MLTSLLLTFREGLEAALIVGIMLGTLTQLGHRVLLLLGCGHHPATAPPPVTLRAIDAITPHQWQRQRTTAKL